MDSGYNRRFLNGEVNNRKSNFAKRKPLDKVTFIVAEIS